MPALPASATTLARHPRYRATARRETRSAAFIAGMVLIAVLVVDALFVGRTAPSLPTPNAAGITLALMGLALLHGPMHRRPDPVAFLLGMTGTGVALQPMTESLEVRTLMLAYVAVLMVAMALFIPWSRAWHGAFLTMAAAALLLAVLLAPLAGPTDPFRTDALVVGTAALLASAAGHLVLGRQRLRAFASEAQLRGLHRRAREQQAELSRLNAELATVSRRDPLTGVGNRLRMEEDVQSIRRDLERTGQPGALALVDVDQFKRFNDRYGHLEGDHVLRQIGSALGANLRAGDGVYRYGGEEFLLLLPGAGIPEAQAVVGRLTAAIANLAIPHPDNAPWGVVTISAGIATMGADDADDWLRSADLALYRAKDAGRNATGLAERGGVRILRRPTAAAGA